MVYARDAIFATGKSYPCGNLRSQLIGSFAMLLPWKQCSRWRGFKLSVHPRQAAFSASVSRTRWSKFTSRRFNNELSLVAEESRIDALCWPEFGSAYARFRCRVCRTLTCVNVPPKMRGPFACGNRASCRLSHRSPFPSTRAAAAATAASASIRIPSAALYV